MRYDLRAAMRRAGVRRHRVVLRAIHVKPGHVLRLARIYERTLDRWEEGQPAIMRAYERAHADGRARDSITDSAADVDEIMRLIALIVLELEGAMVRIRADIQAWARDVERWHRQTWADGVFAATKVDLRTILSEHDVGETVEAVLNRNVELIRGVAAETRARVAENVLRGVQNRIPPREVAKGFADAVDMGRRRANNVARDQAVKLASSLDQARQEEAGVDHFTWQHSGKKHPRQDHVARNGVIYKWRASTPGPGREPPADLPGYLPYCGCVARATLLGDDGKAL